jgi:hypothetical protein
MGKASQEENAERVSKKSKGGILVFSRERRGRKIKQKECPV